MLHVTLKFETVLLLLFFFLSYCMTVSWCDWVLGFRGEQLSPLERERTKENLGEETGTDCDRHKPALGRS